MMKINNYELVKLDICNPDFSNFLIIFAFLAASFFTMSRNTRGHTKFEFLSALHTVQVKGVAIFLVVLGHLWVHVSTFKPHIVLSGDSVAIFLMLSGFGLTISSRNSNPNFSQFCLKRLRRIMVPYWFATLLVLFLDYLLLDQMLDFRRLLLTFLGVNTNKELYQLDYARWFITFIILYYIVFYVLFIRFYSKYSLAYMFLLSFCLFLSDYYLLHFGWYQFLSFPLGCFLAQYRDDVVRIYNKYKLFCIYCSFFVLLYVIFVKFLLANSEYYSFIVAMIPSIFLRLYFECNSILFSLSIIFIVGYFCEYISCSQFLHIVGKYSFEIFLLHGAALIKYNPIISTGESLLLVLQFIIFFSIILFASYCVDKVLCCFYAKKLS